MPVEGEGNGKGKNDKTGETLGQKLLIGGCLNQPI